MINCANSLLTISRHRNTFELIWYHETTIKGHLPNLRMAARKALEK